MESSPAETFSLTDDGLRMHLVPPPQYERLIHKATTLPYNSHMGHGPTLNSTTYMHYGRLSATIKSSKVGGAITAVILISDSGDEIDFEVIGSEDHTAQSPERIVWAVDNEAIRIKNRDETCDDQGCKFPSTPARIQIGFWDGSFEFGTAEWSHGPIDWEKHVDTPITSYLKEIAVECNPEYNEIVHELPSDEETETLEPSLPGETNENGSNSPTKWKPKPADGEQQQQPQDPQQPGTSKSGASTFSHFTLIPLSIITFTLAVLMG
ncbi:hypothetical protein RO3G_13095 [Lichtheimia corymbifera JMRC:FSU:9682]|uniref:GH16 domain-containing protein n=1 Tax=Lichtheimia corymbifera JMRC:FSU:9682 TaxID=1263082 RepID=A0A068RLY2_9FUNG|nr:hypothetical protein RO3G_13095 [Lichtheimia corymbifera JMRC:FSU:9682]